MTSKINVNKKDVKDVSLNIENVVQSLYNIDFDYNKINYSNVAINNINNYISEINSLYQELLLFERKVNNREKRMLSSLVTNLEKLDIDKVNDKKIKSSIKTINNSNLSKKKKLKKIKNKYNKLVELVGRNKANQYMKDLGIKVKITNDVVSLVYVKNANTKTTKSKQAKSILNLKHKNSGKKSSSSNSRSAYQEYAHKLVINKYGWSEHDYECLVKLWNKESGWNPNAHNPKSGAHGIPQSLPANKMASEGSDYYTNGETQIRWGLKYISGRYGNPTAAWAHSQSRGWY